MSVLYTLINERGVDGSGNRRRGVYDVAYTAEAYSAGVALERAKLGAASVLEELHVMDSGAADADLVKYEASSEKLRVYLSGSGTEFAGNLTRTVRVVAEGY